MVAGRQTQMMKRLSLWIPGLRRGEGVKYRTAIPAPIQNKIERSPTMLLREYSEQQSRPTQISVYSKFVLGTIRSLGRSFLRRSRSA